MQIEVEQLRAELQNTLGMYKRACEELVHAQSKVRGQLLLDIANMIRTRFTKKNKNNTALVMALY